MVMVAAGSYDYHYIDQQGREEEEREGEFTSRTGQRTMIKDIIKQEFTIGEGIIKFCLFKLHFNV